jgi:heat shock protein HslJ
MRLLLTAAAALLSACSVGGLDSGELDGRSFASASFTQGGAALTLLAGTDVEIAFYNEFGERGVAVRAGCNTFTAGYRFDGGRLLATSRGQTAMDCGKPLDDQDAWVFGLLKAKPGVVLDGNHLTLTQGDLVGMFLDEREAHPDLGLVGPTWTVGTITSGQVAMPAPAVATFKFSADGQVTIATGCNSGGGTYALNGGTLTFTNIALTAMACAGAAADMERAVVATLNAPGLTYQITASNLSIRSATAGLELSGK